MRHSHPRQADGTNGDHQRGNQVSGQHLSDQALALVKRFTDLNVNS